MRLQKLINLLKKLNITENFSVCYYGYGIFDGSKNFENIAQLDYTTKTAKCFSYDLDKKIFKIDLAY